MPTPKRSFLRGNPKPKPGSSSAGEAAKRGGDSTASGSTDAQPAKRGASKPDPSTIKTGPLPPDSSIAHGPAAPPAADEVILLPPASSTPDEIQPPSAPAIAEEDPAPDAAATADEVQAPIAAAAVEEVQPAVEPALADKAHPPVAPTTVNEVPTPPTPPLPTDLAGARAHLAELQRLMTGLAEDFSLGKINRPQFEAVYAHYREQRQIIDALINSMKTESWRMAIDTELTGKLLERNAAQLVGHAVYDNATGQVLAASHRFKISSGLVAPFIAVYKQVSYPNPAISTSKIAGGQWVCLVSARYTTLVALFSLEPARAQLQLLQDLHRDFELANTSRLGRGEGRQAAEQFIQLWALEKMS